MGEGLRIVPVTLWQANAFVLAHHRHHAPARGHRWSIGVANSHGLCGIAICGRPVARELPHYSQIEVNRLATDGTFNACSKLYGACAAIAKIMGFDDIETSILDSEPGTSLKAAGFEFRRIIRGRDWNTPSRSGRRTDQPMCDKQVWGKQLRQKEDKDKMAYQTSRQRAVSATTERAVELLELAKAVKEVKAAGKKSKAASKEVAKTAPNPKAVEPTRKEPTRKERFENGEPVAKRADEFPIVSAFTAEDMTAAIALMQNELELAEQEKAVKGARAAGKQELWQVAQRNGADLIGGFRWGQLAVYARGMKTTRTTDWDKVIKALIEYGVPAEDLEEIRESCIKESAPRLDLQVKDLTPKG